MKMNIVVLVNRVPEPANVWLNPVATFFGKNRPQGISSFDKYAIEAGVRIKESLGTGKVIAMTVGSPVRQQSLRQAISMGCDNAILVDDKEYLDDDGAQVSQGNIFSNAIKKLGDINIILTGNDRSDDSFGSVGKEVSKFLNIEQVDSILSIEDLYADSITVKRKDQEGCGIVEAPFPVVLTVEEDINTPRVPSARDKIKARRKEIPVWPAKKLHSVENTVTHDKDSYKNEQNFSSDHCNEDPVLAEEKEVYPEEVLANPDAAKENEKSQVYAFEQKTENYSNGSKEAGSFPEEDQQQAVELPDIIDEPEPQVEDNLMKADKEPEKKQKLDFLGYWGLTEKPFENTGSVRYFYYSPTHKEALVRLIYVIKQNKAGALLAGGYGTGKTTIARELLTELEQNDNYKSVYISNPLVNSTELLQEIAYQLGCDSENESRLILRRNITKKLEDIARDGNHSVIVVDEAHLISRKEVLEELRLFMNLQHKEKFLTSIIMMGQLILRDIINSMPQFKQRFAMYYILKQLDESETQKYVKHRLKIAGTEKTIFNSEALSLIYLSSEGRPRQINNICDMALLIGHMRNVDEIDDEMIREIVKDLGQEL